MTATAEKFRNALLDKLSHFNETDNYCDLEVGIGQSCNFIQINSIGGFCRSSARTAVSSSTGLSSPHSAPS